MGYVENKFCDKINYLSDSKKKKIKMIKWRPWLNKHQIWVISCNVLCDYQITVENMQNLHSFYFLPPPPSPHKKKKINKNTFLLMKLYKSLLEI